MSESLLDDAGHWRKRARETRAKAEMARPEAREKLLKVAREYEAIAERAEAKGDPLKSEIVQRWANSPLKRPE